MELNTVVCGDCLDILPTIPDQSVDAVVTDPPYPHIKRDYGYWTTAEWWALMVDGVVPQVRRILKPSGSAVFILQPNSEKVGKMRGWLWEFMAWVCREWNMVQDVYWWNPATLPNVHTHEINGLMRTSLKNCIWAGNQECYRNQSVVLVTIAESVRLDKRIDRLDLENYPSGWNNRRGRLLAHCQTKNGATPYNVLIAGNGQTTNGHGAGTPLSLADWWLRYIVPPGGLVVDPFMGSGTTALAAIKQRKHFFGCDKVPGYVEIANRRIDEAKAETAQIEMILEG